MDFPYEIYRSIWIHLPYTVIKQLSLTTPLFAELATDGYMWYQKALTEFSISPSTYDVLCHELSLFDGYLKIAGLHGVPITGAPRYYNIDVLIEKLLGQESVDPELILEYAETDLEGSLRLLSQVPAASRKELVDVINDRYSNKMTVRMIQEAAVTAAAASGDFPLFKELVPAAKERMSLSPALASGNMDMVQWIMAQHPVQIDDLTTDFPDAVASGNVALVCWVFEQILVPDDDIDIGDFNLVMDAALATAAKSGNIEMMDVLTGMYEYPYSILTDAVESKNSNLIAYVLTHKDRFSTESDDDGLLFEALGLLGDLTLIDRELTPDLPDYESKLREVLEGACRNGQLQVLRHLDIPQYMIQLLLETHDQHECIVRYLLHRGAEVTKDVLKILAYDARVQLFIDCYQRCPSPNNAATLHAAIMGGNRAVVEFMYSVHPHFTNIDNSEMSCRPHLENLRARLSR